MKDGDDNVFSRWSRRKLAARQPGPATEAERPDATAAAIEPAAEAKPTDVAPAERANLAAGAVRAEAGPLDAAAPSDQEADPLPRIEDLQADSDLAAFLREGVPAALKNSALRKMWSLDPAIRDHVGLAEYAWNFNEPGSMGGFGPLEPGSRVVDFFSTVGRSVLAGQEEASDAAGQAAAPSEPTDALPPEVDAVHEAGSGPAAAEEPPEAKSGQARAEAASEMPAETGAIEAGRKTAAESAPRPPRRRHGGALPR